MKILRWIISILALIVALLPLLFAVALMEPGTIPSALGMLLAGLSGLAFAFIVNPLSAKLAVFQSTKAIWLGAIAAFVVGVIGLVIGMEATDGLGKSDYTISLIRYGKEHGNIEIERNDYDYYENCLGNGGNTQAFRSAALQDKTKESENSIIPYIGWYMERNIKAYDDAYMRRELTVSFILNECAKQKPKN
ncbi:hypothetical protein [Sphingomonas sp. GB1N7]|uniref:hypothetical protein n=1 Tax=Parasphingomonas caseinilytica TaxID=3096158 RepID=UPI002FC630BF